MVHEKNVYISIWTTGILNDAGFFSSYFTWLDTEISRGGGGWYPKLNTLLADQLNKHVKKDVPELKWEKGVLYFEKSGLISLAILFFNIKKFWNRWFIWLGKGNGVLFVTLLYRIFVGFFNLILFTNIIFIIIICKQRQIIFKKWSYGSNFIWRPQ